MSRRGDVARTVLRGLGELSITLGLVVLLFCVYEVKVTNLVTAREQERLSRDLRAAWAQPAPRAAVTAEPVAPGPTRPPAPDEPLPSGPPSPAPEPSPELGSGVAVLHVPRLGDWNDEPPVVVEGVSVADLKKGPGHMPGTALPGEVGNVVLSGHRTTYGAPFQRFDELRPGDPVVLETRDAWFTYAVQETRIVAPTAISVAYPVPGDRSATPTRRLLTLTTCHPEYSARQRLVVSAELTAADPKSGPTPAALRGL